MGGIKIKKIIRPITLIDCDPGIDDALALALAMASPELDLCAITTVHGNVPVGVACRNARRVVSFLSAHVNLERECPPIYPGAGKPLGGGRIDRRISYAIHGADGLGDLFRNTKLASLAPWKEDRADGVIATLARRLGSALCIIAVGPLTNLALAVKLDRKAMAGVGRIVVMGGAAQVPGNVTETAEFNTHCDPEAAHIVMNCGARVTMIGLDVTRRVVLPSCLLVGGGPFRGALRALVRPYVQFSNSSRGVDGVTLHDPLAVAAAIEPNLIRCVRRRVEVECGNVPTRGMTVVDIQAEPSAPRSLANSVEVALEVDDRRFIRFFLERLKAYRGWS